MHLDEFQRIERFTSAFSEADGSVVAGPGDDCALTRLLPGKLLVSKVDQIVEGVHFGPAFRPDEVGHKALAVALSDLAAAGAEPKWILVALAVPGDREQAFLDGIAKGMARLARLCGVALIGGNFTAASEFSVSVTALGQVAPEYAIRRGGGWPGDRLFVSGTLGRAALGLRELAGGRPRRLTAAIRAQLKPEPRIRLGGIAGRYASAGVDLSDGLLQDLGHLCSRSEVGAELWLEALPLAKGLDSMGEGGLALALGGGEDYELLFAVPPERAAAFRRAAKRQEQPVHEIGVLSERPGVRLLDAAGKERPLPEHQGWTHFPSDE